jgi:hypothetical protein
MKQTLDHAPKEEGVVHNIDRIRTCLLESTDTTFQHLFGQHASRLLYANLEEDGLPRHMIPEMLTPFCSAIERICGTKGGSAVQYEIAKRLYLNLGLTFTHTPVGDLPDYVFEAMSTLNRTLTRQ